MLTNIRYSFSLTVIHVWVNLAFRSDKTSQQTTDTKLIKMICRGFVITQPKQGGQVGNYFTRTLQLGVLLRGNTPPQILTCLTCLNRVLKIKLSVF